MRVTAPTIMSLAVLVVIGSGCDEKLRDIAGPTPDLQPTFASIQRDVFNAADSTGRPACTSCHSANSARPPGNLSLGENAYQNLVGVPSTGKAGAIRVVPGDPDASYLLKKVLGAPDIVGDRMPRRGPYLSEGQIRIIRRWIELGAKND
jgi:hypothetical protein